MGIGGQGILTDRCQSITVKGNLMEQGGSISSGNDGFRVTHCNQIVITNNTS